MMRIARVHLCVLILSAAPLFCEAEAPGRNDSPANEPTIDTDHSRNIDLFTANPVNSATREIPVVFPDNAAALAAAMNVERSTSNVERRTLNVERSTLNSQLTAHSCRITCTAHALYDGCLEYGSKTASVSWLTV